MKYLILLPAFLCLGATARAQWQTTSYTLKGGWNAIHLSGDVKYASLDTLFPAQVEEIWRWNPNPTQVQFTESPLIPSAGLPEWSVWKRGQPSQSALTQLSGQTAYLVKCSGSGSTTFTVNLVQAVLPPVNTWVRSGANLMGFPSRLNGTTYPLFSSYFATFPIATATNTRLFKYVGGDLGPANPLQIFSPSLERLDRTRAYWFSAEVVGNFTAPLEVSLTTNQGLAFGRTGSGITARLRNRTAAPMTVTFTPVNSEAAPLGQLPVTGPVPLTRRTYNPSTLVWEETPVTAAFDQVIGPSSTVELAFGINRADSAMSGAAANAAFASFLRLTDSGNLFDIQLPASATKASLAGLWVGDISLKQAGYTSTGAGNTPREFPLRTILHVSDAGTASLLSQVYLGQLAAGSHPMGLCTRESLLKQDAKATAQRLVATHLPLDQVLTSGSGSVAPGGSLVRTIQVPFDDATNPFVHQYHPDHDNKNPRGAALTAGGESYDITRTCTFSFTAAPPPGSSTTSGWGSAVIGGNYREEITGLHRRPITLTGTFELRRASEDGTLFQ